MTTQEKPVFQRIDSKSNGTYHFDGDMIVNRDVWRVLPVTVLAQMVQDIQERVKKDKGLKIPEQLYEFDGKKVIFFDKQSREESLDENIEKFTRRRNHAFTVKVEE